MPVNRYFDNEIRYLFFVRKPVDRLIIGDKIRFKNIEATINRKFRHAGETYFVTDQLGQIIVNVET